MTKTAALCASLLMLTACAKPSLPEPALLPAVSPPDPRVCAQPLAEPPVVGSIVAPVSAAEVSATREHLVSDAEARAWGRMGWEIVAVARRACPG